MAPQIPQRSAMLLAIAIAGGCGLGIIDDPQNGPVDHTETLTFKAAPAALRRLTISEYQSTLRALFGDDIRVPTDLESDTIINGLEAIGAGSVTVSANAVEKLEAAALDIAAQAIAPARRARLGVCTPENAADSACWSSLTTTLGRKIFRRPLEQAEVARYAALGAAAATALEDVWEGTALIIAGLLESPNFVFRVELPEPDPDDATRSRYDSYAIATRIAYFLTNAPPDDELAALADAGALTDARALASQVTRLLASPKSATATADFFRDWLRLERLDTLAKDSAIYPEASAELSAEMKEDLVRSVAAIVGDGNGDYRDLFTSDIAFAGARLGDIYGVTVGDAIEQIRAPAVQDRIGLLGKPGFLALYAASDRSSPTLRGKFVREAILCESVAAPPPEVATVVPEADASAPTMRDRLAKHRTGTCAGCHNLMDPIGLTLEAFDGIGSYRTTENGVTLDLSGDIDGEEVIGLAELAEQLVDDPRLTTCAARTMYRYAVGHVETKGEEASIVSIAAQFTASQYTTKALMAAIASSDGFRFAAPLTESP